MHLQIWPSSSKDSLKNTRSTVMGHRLFFGQTTRPSIQLKWLMDSSEILKPNIAFKVLRTLVGGSYKYGQIQHKTVHWTEGERSEDLRLPDSTQSTVSASKAPADLRALSCVTLAGIDREEPRWSRGVGWSIRVDQYFTGQLVICSTCSGVEGEASWGEERRMGLWGDAEFFGVS